jgi:hypothetical protein
MKVEATAEWRYENAVHAIFFFSRARARIAASVRRTGMALACSACFGACGGVSIIGSAAENGDASTPSVDDASAPEDRNVMDAYPQCATRPCGDMCTDCPGPTGCTDVIGHCSSSGTCVNNNEPVNCE